MQALLLIGDTGSAATAAWLAPALWVLFDPAFVPTAGLPTWQWVFAVLWVGMLRLFHAGDSAVAALDRRVIHAIWQSAIAVGVLILVLFYVAPFFVPRGSTLLTLPVVATLTLVWRLALSRMFRRVPARVVAVVGVDEAATRAGRAMVKDHSSAYQLVAVLVDPSADVDTHGLAAPIVRVDRDFWDVLDRLSVDLLVVGHSHTVSSQILAELVRCYEHGIEAVPATTVFEQLEGRVMVSALEADWYAELPTGTRSLYMIAKRAFDVSFALAFGLLMLPVMVVVAIAIWSESGRPILFRQVRVGLRGERFVFHKFRSMRVDSEPEGPRWASLGDDRVTRIGGFLRGARLDELPQLWDVLRGKMSVIGPRPERPEFIEQLANELPLYRARLLVPPGITGWAQVQYRYAGSLAEGLAKLEFDLYYIRHLGPQLDARILLRTVVTVLRRAGR